MTTLDPRWFDMRTDAEVNAGDLGKEKKWIILVPEPKPEEAPVTEPAVEPETAPAAEPVPA